MTATTQALTATTQTITAELALLKGIPGRLDELERQVQELSAKVREGAAQKPLLEPERGHGLAISAITVSSETFTNDTAGECIKEIAETWVLGMPKESILPTNKYPPPPYETRLPYYHAYPGWSTGDVIEKPLKAVLTEMLQVSAAKNVDEAFNATYKIKQKSVRKPKGPGQKRGTVEKVGVEGILQRFRRERRQAKSDKFTRVVGKHVEDHGIPPH